MSRGSMAEFALATLAGLLLAGSAQAYTVYVTNEKGNTVSVIDTATGEVAKTLKTAPGAHGVSVSADGAFVFVTNIADDSVSVIDVARQEVVGSVPVGDRPNGIVYGPSN